MANSSKEQPIEMQETSEGNNVKRLAVLLGMLLVVACTPQVKNSTAGAETAPTPEAIRATRLSVSLKSATGKQVQVYLYADDEQISVQGVPSCMAERGDTVRTGTYRFYLAAEGETDLHLQSVSPFPDPLLFFNDQRPNYLRVFPRSTSGLPDLLMLMQYGSCNGDALAILSLSPDGTELVQYQFKTDDGKVWHAVGTKGVQYSLPSTVQTSIYNNATGKTTAITWDVRDDDAQLVAVKTEIRQRQ